MSDEKAPNWMSKENEKRILEIKKELNLASIDSTLNYLIAFYYLKTGRKELGRSSAKLFPESILIDE